MLRWMQPNEGGADRLAIDNGKAIIAIPAVVLAAYVSILPAKDDEDDVSHWIMDFGNIRCSFYMPCIIYAISLDSQRHYA